MDDLNDRMEQLRTDIIAAADDVSSALESGEDDRQLAAGKTVEEITKRYQALIASVEGAERTRVEMSIGRRVTDLRRAADALTKRMAGRKTELAVDAGQVPFLLQRQPGKSIVPQRAAPTRDQPRYSVGGEVDSWCGKCKEVRTHNIVAIVGGEPKQVVCQTCNSRHNFRTEPPARARAAEGGAPAPKRGSPEERELKQRQDQKRVLQKELADAVDPRPFDPKARYKAGEIIVHPELGRGKIENVLRSSLLVRFVDGLRPLDLA